MYRIDGIDVLNALVQVRRHARDPRSKAAICRLEWVLCVAFDDISAVEDAFEHAYRAMTDAGNQSLQRFEAATRDIERAYDCWLAATLARAERVSDVSPTWGRPSGGAANTPYLYLQPTKRTAG